jgi:hypothetical protein
VKGKEDIHVSQKYKLLYPQVQRWSCKQVHQ